MVGTTVARVPPVALPALEPVEVNGLRYRRATSDDVAGVLALWDIAGWGPVTQAEFRRRWLEGPIGPALVLVIEDRSERVVGSRITDFKVALMLGSVAIVRRGHATVLAPELRRRARGQREVLESDPDQEMRRLAERYLNDSNVHAGLSIPNPMLLDRPRFSNVERVERRFASLKLTMSDVETRPSTLEVSRMPSFHSGYDSLWERGVHGLKLECAVMRTSAWLNHLRDSDMKLECRSRSTGALVGYASAKFTDVWKLHDVFAEDEDALAAVVQSVAMWFKRSASRFDPADADRPKFDLSAVDHPLYGPHLRALGARETEWEFRLRINTGIADRPLGPEHDPERWYFTMGD